MWASTTTLQLETSLDRQAGQRCRGRSTIPTWATPAAALQYRIQPTKNIQQSQAAWRRATERMHHFQNPYQTAFTELNLFQR